MTTPRQVLEYFSGVSVRGVDLSPALSTGLRITFHHSRWQDSTLQSRIQYRLARLRPVLTRLLRRGMPCGDAELSNARYLFLLVGTERMNQLTWPIIDALAPASRLAIYTHHSQWVPDRSVEQVSLRSLPWPGDEWEAELAGLWPELVSRVDRAARHFGLGSKIRLEILSTLAWAVGDVVRAGWVLEQARPAIVVTEHDRRPAEAVFCQVARQRGIPTMTLVHGTQVAESWEDTQWTPLIADRMIAWGEWMRSSFVASGVPAEQIVVGGYPRFRPPTGQDVEEAGELLQRQGQDGDKPVALLVSSNLGEKKPAVELFLSAQVCMPDLLFMVRPHPRESLDWYATNAPGGLATVQDPSSWTLAQSLASATVVVGSGSTACLDAILAGKLVVFVPDPGGDFENIPVFKDAVQAGAARAIHDTAQLCETLEQIRSAGENATDQSAVEAFAEQCAACLGEEAARVSAALISQFALAG